MQDLEKQEKEFLEQATHVNAWDRLLVENGEKVSRGEHSSIYASMYAN